jgi:hypothetical protein
VGVGNREGMWSARDKVRRREGVGERTSGIRDGGVEANFCFAAAR